MQEKKCLLIINPISGTSNKRGLDRLVVERLKDMGLAIETVWTTAHGHAYTSAKKAVEDGFDSVIVAGGDGTVNETAAALIGTQVKMGIIPCGSGNGLARHLEIPIDIDGALEVIEMNDIKACDYGTINDKPFFCTAGVGFDAEVSLQFAAEKKRGFSSYIKSVIKKLREYKGDEYRISVNGEVITERAFIIAVCNASQYGNNAYIAPKASITDGLLDITIVHKGNAFSTAFMGVELMTGYIDKDTHIKIIRVPEATISRNNPGAAHIDGEPMLLDDTLHVKCVPASIRIYTNTKKTKFKPIITPAKSSLKRIKYKFKRLFKKSNYKNN